MENTLYINLSHRKDRLEHVKKQLKSMDVGGERIEAVYYKNHGAIGCGMSHIKCIEHAKLNNWPRVFICEDDIRFTDPTLLKSQLHSFLELKNGKWDVLLIGANIGPPFTYEYTNENIKLDGFVRVFNAQTTTGYIVNRHYYDTLLASFRQSVGNLIRDYNIRYYAIDIQWKKLQQRDKWYILDPLTVVQKADYSDIESKLVNYETMMLDKKYKNNT